MAPQLNDAPQEYPRIALAQIDLRVGDLKANAAAVLLWSQRAFDAGAQIVAFPELTLAGYPPEDLVLRRSFVDANSAALTALASELDAAGLGGLTVIVGFIDRSAGSGEVQNSAAVLRAGLVEATYAKRLLPNYGVFDEQRYFEAGAGNLVIDVGGVPVGIVVCEDVWESGPVEASAEAGAAVVIAINASPYEVDKDDVRLELCAARAISAGVPLAYVNCVGGQDELVFDGDSLMVGADGSLLSRAGQFEEELLVLDAALSGPIRPSLDRLGEIYGALVVGTRDYVRKNGFSSVALGLSGGIDSAVVATIAVDALGAENVFTVALPSAISSQHSLDDAAELARRQGTQHSVVPIKDAVEAFRSSLELSGLAVENLQARVRGVILMALSNQHGHLVLTTGNKSELATGFSTLYGDAAGGFGPIKDVLKTVVWELARWRNAHAIAQGATPPIPDNSIDKPPSAELADGQLDSDRLPEYPVLDAILAAYIERDEGRASIIAAGHDSETVDRVIRLVDLAEYKRRQYPPGPKVTSKAFGRDRRLPITNAWRE